MPRQFGDRFGPRNIGDVLGGAFSTAGQAFGDVPQQIEERDYEREFLENEREHQRTRQSILDDQARETQLAQLQSLSQAFDIGGAAEGRKEELFPAELTAADLANELTRVQTQAIREGRGKTGTKGLSPSEEARRQGLFDIKITAEEERLERVTIKKELDVIGYNVSDDKMFNAFGVKGKEAIAAAEELNRKALATVKAEFEAAAPESGPREFWDDLEPRLKRRLIKDRIDKWLETAGGPLDGAFGISAGDIGASR